MKRSKCWPIYIMLMFLTLSLQSCLDIGDNGNFQTKGMNNGTQIGINQTTQANFKGKLYFTLQHNLYTLDSQHNLTQLTRGMNVRDPAVSPDGKWIAFIATYKNYTDLMLMSTTGGQVKTLRSGNGTYIANPNSEFPKATYLWYAQPSWAADSKHLLFLSDLAKPYADAGVDAFLLDLQVFSIAIDDPTATPQVVAYATYGDGGNRDPSFRPGHADQIIYTHYQYDPKTNYKQLVQIYLEDPNAISNNPGKYRPGTSDVEVDPALALTPPEPDLVNFQPNFSPDGNAIAYIRRLDATHMGLFIMPVPTDPGQLIQDPNNPDTQKKALASYAKSVQIVSGEYISQPVWSADGKQIAYIGYSNNTFDIRLANIELDKKTGAYSLKGEPIQLTDTKGQLDAESRPFWTP
ncbi:PD40 domain-containing protein [Ktedonosporobacter rubrisoli]|nr:PD40 domain-containing protein [Ktedonosporobacter rubrisoli]